MTEWKLPADARVMLYDHGGGRVYLDRPSGGRDLILDLYACDGDDPGARRDAILAMLGAPPPKVD